MTRRGPVGGFVIGVFKGGFAGWLMIAPFWIAMNEFSIAQPFANLIGVAMTMAILLLLGFFYCNLVITIVFPLPMLAEWLGNRFPEHSLSVSISIATISSTFVWIGFLTIMFGPLFLTSILDFNVSTAEFALLLPALAGGLVAGHTFWKHAFPGSTRS